MRVKFLLKNLLSASIFLLLLQVSFAQTSKPAKIDLKVESEEFSSVLNRLSTISGLNFTYDASDSLFSSIVSCHYVATPPLAVLGDLLSNTTHTFKQVGNQIVIYKDKSKSRFLPEEKKIEVVAVDNTAIIIPFQDEAFLIPLSDTVFIQDTIIKIQTDTIRIIDTVFVERELAIDTLTKSSLKSFNANEVREDGWSATAFFAPVLSGFSLANTDRAFDVRNFSMGVEVSRIKDKWNFIGGLKLTHFAEKFNHSYSITEGGFFVTDTVDQYYTIVQSDTSWFYVTDSTWKPANYNEYNYNINNRLGYLELAALVSYNFYSSGKINIYGKAGIQMSVLIYKSGLAIPNESKPSGVDFADLSFKSPAFSFLVGAGIKYRINEHIDFNPELYYFRGFNQAVNDYPIEKRISGLGIKIGVTYYFN